LGGNDPEWDSPGLPREGVDGIRPDPGAVVVESEVRCDLPGSLTVPVNEEGKATFKPDMIAPANGFRHKNPRDALSDVEATIYMCRLIASARAG
jgi:hypothetical protein